MPTTATDALWAGQFVVRAIYLAQNPQQLQVFREHLRQQKYHLPLFDAFDEFALTLHYAFKTLGYLVSPGKLQAHQSSLVLTHYPIFPILPTFNLFYQTQSKRALIICLSRDKLSFHCSLFIVHCYNNLDLLSFIDFKYHNHNLLKT